MSSKCGAYQITTARIDTAPPTRHLTRRSGRMRRTTPVAPKAIAKCGRVHVPTTPATQKLATAHVRPDDIGLERSDGHDAHRQEGEAVAARETRDVEEQRRDGCEGQKQDCRQRSDTNVQPCR